MARALLLMLPRVHRRSESKGLVSLPLCAQGNNGNKPNPPADRHDQKARPENLYERREHGHRTLPDALVERRTRNTLISLCISGPRFRPSFEGDSTHVIGLVPTIYEFRSRPRSR